MTYRLIVQDDAIGAWTFHKVSAVWTPGSGATIGVSRDGVIVAGIVFTNYTGSNVWATMAIDDPRAVTRKALFLVFWYAFVQLNVRRISAHVDWNNTRSQRLLEHLGFTREATLVDAAPDGDVFVYRIFKEDCTWLRSTRERR